MYELVIVGGGPAGLTVGIYARRAKLETLLLEKSFLGGQMVLANTVENYPGFPETRGAVLAQKFEEHARGLGLDIREDEVTETEDYGVYKVVRTTLGEYEAKAVIISSGAEPRRMGVKGENEFIGKGVSFCATCDGPFFAGKDVLVVGGGDAAVTEAIHLTKMVNSVRVVHRRAELRAEKINQERAFSNPKIKFIWNSVVEEISGKDRVEKVTLKNLKTNEVEELKVDGVFVYVGRKPNTDFVNVKKDEAGYILTDEYMESSSKGIFAAGDCRSPLWRQVAVSVGEGAQAAISAARYVEGLKT